MKQIKIKKEFWDAIVSGEKRFEFRKLSKGLESGTYEFYDSEKYIEGEDIECSNFEEHDKYHFEEQLGSSWSVTRCNYCEENTNKPLGTAHLEPLLVNPTLLVEYGNIHEDGYRAVPFIDGEGDDFEEPIHFESWVFITENYTNKHREDVDYIDYVVYKISEVKNATN